MSMIHRSFLSLLFAVLLVLAQHMAMLHPYVHVADGQQNSTQDNQNSSKQDKQAPRHTEVCGKCVALADIENLVGSTSQALSITLGQYVLATDVNQSFSATQLLSYHSRAPPSLV
ncbi:MAG: hypothetical protein V4445_08505 [Pseudomonadota bacterium]